MTAGKWPASNRPMLYMKRKGKVRVISIVCVCDGKVWVEQWLTET